MASSFLPHLVSSWLAGPAFSKREAKDPTSTLLSETLSKFMGVIKVFESTILLESASAELSYRLSMEEEVPALTPKLSMMEEISPPTFAASTFVETTFVLL